MPTTTTTTHEHDFGERMATMEAKVSTVIASIERMESNTLAGIQANLARLGEIAAVQEERYKAASDAVRLKDAEVNRRMDEFGKCWVDNVAEHAGFLRSLQTIEQMAKDGDAKLEDRMNEADQRIVIAKAQMKVWTWIGAGVFTVINFLKEPLLALFKHTS